MLTDNLPITSELLFKQAQKYTPGGVQSPAHAFKGVGGNPFVTDSAEGAYLTTVEGTKYVDFVGAWGPAILGHNNPDIKAAILEALEKGTGYGTANPYSIKLCEKVVNLVPSLEKVRMVSSGTEATMSAVRVARAYTGRDKIIKFAGCYHGHADYFLVKAGSGLLTFGNPDSAGVPKAFAEKTLVLNFNDIEALEKTFQDNKGEVAALILEPYIGNCGFILPDPGYLKAVRELCTKHGTVLIFDEVMTGFRIALGGVQEREGVIPDMTTLGKVIGGGLPVGAFGGKAEIMAMLSPEGPAYQAGTMSGNPLAMAAGYKALCLLEETNPYHLLDNLGKFITNAIQQAAKEKGMPIQTPQVGSMYGIFFSDKPVRNFDDACNSELERFRKLFRMALEKGVFLPPSPFEANFISTAHQGEPIEKAAEVLYACIKAL